MFTFCPLLEHFRAKWCSERERGGEITMDRPFYSSSGAPGAEFGPIGPKINGKTWILASKNGGSRPDLVDGCSRSGDRFVELLVMKTLVFQSQTCLHIRDSHENRVLHENRKFCMKTDFFNYFFFF